MKRPASVPMECSARRYKAIPPLPGSRPRTKSFLLSNSITLPIEDSPTLDFVPKQNCGSFSKSAFGIPIRDIIPTGKDFDGIARGRNDVARHAGNIYRAES